MMAVIVTMMVGYIDSDSNIVIVMVIVMLKMIMTMMVKDAGFVYRYQICNIFNIL